MAYQQTLHLVLECFKKHFSLHYPNWTQGLLIPALPGHHSLKPLCPSDWWFLAADLASSWIVPIECYAELLLLPLVHEYFLHNALPLKRKMG